MPPRDDESRVADIVLAARRVQRFVADVNRDEFLADERTVYAVLHALLLIGEAASHLSEQFKQEHETLPWVQITGLRNRLVHEYFVIDNSIVWDITQNDIPKMLEELSPLIDLDG